MIVWDYCELLRDEILSAVDDVLKVWTKVEHLSKNFQNIMIKFGIGEVIAQMLTIALSFLH